MATNRIGFSSDFVLVNGNVGVGTTNSLQKLHVLGNLLVAAGSATTQHITQKAYELNSGTLSWEGTAGQLFSITNNLTSGSIFSVNDVSGIPSIDVNADGTVSMVSYGGNIGIGTTSATSKLDIVGNVKVTGIVTATSFSGNATSATYATSAGVSTSVIGGIGSITQLQVSGITTSAEFVGGGSDLRNLSGTHLVSYASAADISNSALSISGISTYNQVGILTGSFAVDSFDYFGLSVATSADGKTIVVCASSDEIGATTRTGVVYVYDRVGTSFNQVGILTGSLAVDASDNFGTSVATSADGKTIIVGANNDEIGAPTDNGVAYVFDRVGNSFNQVGILTGSLANGSYPNNDNFGTSVATSADGKTIIVGAYRDELSGTTGYGLVYVYDRVGTSFNQVGILTGSLAVDASDLFGNSVATSADGKTIVVGAVNDEASGSGSSSGVVYVYDRVGSSFNQVGILTGSLAVDATDLFGYSVATSADGKTIIVGAYQDEIGATTGTGVVYVFDRVGSSFNQVGILTGSLAVDANDFFGSAVATSADGKTIIVGASSDEIGATTSTGVAYIFKRQGNSFNQVGILTGSLAVDASDNFGTSVATSADGKTIIVGASTDEIGATTGTGVVYVFDETRDTYVYSGPTGNIGIGTTNPSQSLHVQGNVRITGGLYDSNNNVGTAGSILSSTGSAISWIAAGGVTISNDTSTNAIRYPIFEDITSGITTNINVSSTKLTFNPSTGTLSATQFTSLSDANKKKNIRPIENAIDITKKLEGVRFDWIDNDEPSIGVIAQDVEKVLPELVVESGGTKSVSYGNIIGVLIEAIKEQQVRIEELERKLNA
jgi:glutamate synthase domain-containing protein 3